MNNDYPLKYDCGICTAPSLGGGIPQTADAYYGCNACRRDLNLPEHDGVWPLKIPTVKPANGAVHLKLTFEESESLKFLENKEKFTCTALRNPGQSRLTLEERKELWKRADKWFFRDPHTPPSSPRYGIY